MILKAEFSPGDCIPFDTGNGRWRIKTLVFSPSGCVATKRKTLSKKNEPEPIEFTLTFPFCWGDTFWTATQYGEIVDGAVSSVVADPDRTLINGLYPVCECFPTRDAMVVGTFELIMRRRAYTAEMSPEHRLLVAVFGGAE